MKSSGLFLKAPNKRLITAGMIFFLLFSFIAGLNEKWKILGISWIAFVSMAGAIPWGIHSARKHNPTFLITGYGITSGAMITSAAIFLIPIAINHNAVYGGLGIALGIMTGFAIHQLNHQSHHRAQVDSIVLELIAHALTAGIVIGIVYATMPGLSLLLGVAIVSHKAPAGYAAARKLAIADRSPWLLLLPACAIGIAALPISLANFPVYSAFNGLIFGFATGVFFHVAIDFLPKPESIKGDNDIELHKYDSSQQPVRNRMVGVLSTFTGGIIVFVLWYISH